MSINEKVKKENWIFFLGGHDAEMEEIRRILEDRGRPFFDRGLAWGAAVSAYAHEIGELRPGKVPVFIELKPDFPVPEGAIFIDHHGPRAGHDQKTSIERVADLLGIELNRRERLISANDRGYIQAMRAMGATEEEIIQVRAEDRRAQGVTAEDERLAEESLAHRTEVWGPSIIFVQSLTEKTSPVADRIPDFYEHVLIITPSGELNYFGSGEIIDRLRARYEAWAAQESGLEFWFGGDLPSRGFFGAKRSLPVEELKQIMLEMVRVR